MIRRFAFLTLAVTAALAVGTAALAKGPLGATIEGEGVTGTLVIDEPGELGQGTVMSELVEAVGFFPLVFGDESVMAAQPTETIGKQRIVITWDLGDGASVVEEIYHHAAGGPLAFLAPGQAFWEDTAETTGGWFAITGDIATPLIELGVDRAALTHLLTDPSPAPDVGAAATRAAAQATAPAPAPVASVAQPSDVTPRRLDPQVLLVTVTAIAALAGVWVWRGRRRLRAR